jgi:hypothetical protein
MGVVGDCKNEGEREWSRQRKRKKRDVGMGLPSQVKVEGSARIMNESGRGNVSGDLFSLSSSSPFCPAPSNPLLCPSLSLKYPHTPLKCIAGPLPNVTVILPVYPSPWVTIPPMVHHHQLRLLIRPSFSTSSPFYALERHA